MLEHLTYEEARRTLRNWFTVLKDGGTVDICVPDIGEHMRQFGQKGISPYSADPVSNRDHAIAGFYGWQRNNRDIHKSGYTYEFLSEIMINTGFVHVERVQDESMSGSLNLRITARKPAQSGVSAHTDIFVILKKMSCFNWIGLAKRIISKAVFMFYERFQIDYTGSGQRQVSNTIEGIREDHKGRYFHAAQFIKEKEIVLDCACGVGYGTWILANETALARITGVDLSGAAIKYAEKYYSSEKIEYICSDIFNFHPKGWVYDTIVSFETVEHVKDADRLIEYFGTLMKPGGKLIISTPNEQKMTYNKNTFRFHERHFTPAEFEKLLTVHKFEIIAKFTQHGRESGDVSVGWDGLYNIAVAVKKG